MSNDFHNIKDKLLANANLSLRPKISFISQANRNYADEIAKKGDVINIPKDQPSVATDVTPSGNRPDALPDDNFDNYQMRITQWKEVTFSLNDKERHDIRVQANYLPPVVHSKIRALAETCESYVAGKYVQLYNFVGTAGSDPFASDHQILVDANKVLTDNHNERSERSFIMNTDAEANAMMLPAFADVSQSGQQDVKVEGMLGRKFGVNNVVSTFIPTHTTGAAGTVLAVDAQTAASATTVDSITGVKVTTLNVDGLSGQPVAGDKFTIAGSTQQHVVVSSTTIASTASTLTIEPPLAADVADNAELTFVASHTANVVMHKRALTFAQRNLETDSATNDMISNMPDPVSGLSLRLEAQRAHKADVFSLDMLYDADYVNKESAVIALG